VSTVTFNPKKPIVSHYMHILKWNPYWHVSNTSARQISAILPQVLIIQLTAHCKFDWFLDFIWYDNATGSIGPFSPFHHRVLLTVLVFLYLLNIIAFADPFVDCLAANTQSMRVSNSSNSQLKENAGTPTSGSIRGKPTPPTDKQPTIDPWDTNQVTGRALQPCMTYDFWLPPFPR